MEKYYTLFKETSGVCTDTRNIVPNSLFVALKGANFDGNTFVKDAINSGAKYSITSVKELADDQKIFFVDDTLKFLQDLANFHRQQFDIPVIGITGSNGKTTTKELVREVLKTQYNTLATKGNLNNHIGVPLTLLRLSSDHEIAVIEMGANKPGDIKELAEITEPTHGIITNIGKAHLEGFGGFQGVYKTKTALYRQIEKSNGVFFINVDYPEFSKLHSYDNKVTFGTKNADLSGELIKQNPFVTFDWKTETSNDVVKTQIIGEYNFYNLLAATCIGLHFNISKDNINLALSNYVSDNNRSQIIKKSDNTILLDAYNANPSSVESALNSFAKMEGNNKVVILGDMLELGDVSQVEHQKILDLIKSHNFHYLLVGDEFAKLNDNNHVNNYEETKSFCKSLNDSLILVKGSRGIKLENIVEFIS